jgi:hypothetical protein
LSSPCRDRSPTSPITTRSAALDRRHDLELAEAHMAGMRRTPSRPAAADRTPASRYFTSCHELPRERFSPSLGISRPSQSARQERNTPIRAACASQVVRNAVSEPELAQLRFRQPIAA